MHFNTTKLRGKDLQKAQRIAISLEEIVEKDLKSIGKKGLTKYDLLCMYGDYWSESSYGRALHEVGVKTDEYRPGKYHVRNTVYKHKTHAK